jgi:hypothetical protein
VRGLNRLVWNQFQADAFFPSCKVRSESSADWELSMNELICGAVCFMNEEKIGHFKCSFYE